MLQNRHQPASEDVPDLDLGRGRRPGYKQRILNTELRRVEEELHRSAHRGAFLRTTRPDRMIVGAGPQPNRVLRGGHDEPADRTECHGTDFSLVPPEGVEERAGFAVPDPHGPIVSHGQKPVTVRAEVDSSHIPLVSSQASGAGFLLREVP